MLGESRRYKRFLRRLYRSFETIYCFEEDAESERKVYSGLGVDLFWDFGVLCLKKFLAFVSFLDGGRQIRKPWTACCSTFPKSKKF